VTQPRAPTRRTSDASPEASAVVDRQVDCAPLCVRSCEGCRLAGSSFSSVFPSLTVLAFPGEEGRRREGGDDLRAPHSGSLRTLAASEAAAAS